MDAVQAVHHREIDIARPRRQGAAANGHPSGVGRVSETVPTAREMAFDAEELVRRAEHALAAATDPTARDIFETELQAAMELQDKVMAAVAPALEEEARAVRLRAWQVLDPSSSFDLKRRRSLSPAVTSHLINRIGLHRYMNIPW